MRLTALFRGLHSGKRMILVCLLALLVSGIGFAQQDSKDDKWEQIKAQKVAYLTVKMELTPEESSAFWPIYHEYAEKRDKLLKEIFPRLSDEEWEKMMDLSDKEAAEGIDEYFIKQTKLLQVEKEYNARFRKVLQPKKVLRLYIAEMMFKKELFNDLRKSKKESK